MLIKDKQELISHYNDAQNNHTYYLINIGKCFEKAIYLDYSLQPSKININKCKFCKAYPFEINDINLQNNQQKKISKSNQNNKIKKILSEREKSERQNCKNNKSKNYFQCLLCSSLSQKQLRLDLNQQEQNSKSKVNEPGYLTPYLINFQPNQNNQKSNLTLKEAHLSFSYSIYLIFFLDLSVSVSILQHFKNVLLQVYKSLVKQNKQQKQIIVKNQKIALFLLIQAKLYVFQLQNEDKNQVNFQLICLQSFVLQKQTFSQILQRCLFQCTQKNLYKFQEFMNILIQEKQENLSKNFSLDGGKFFHQILSSIKKDKSPLNYYIPIWIGKIPPINYTQNDNTVFRYKNVYSILFLFYDSYKKNKKRKNSEEQTQEQAKYFSDLDQFNITIGNQIEIVNDNDEVNFLEDNEGNVEFYYKFYRVFNVYENLQIFDTKIQIKADCKYKPKIISKYFNKFQIKENDYFLIRSDNNSQSTKFQISIQFDDAIQNKKLLLINWTTTNLNVMDRFVGIHSCINQTVKNLFTQIYNYKRKQLKNAQTQGRVTMSSINTNKLTIFLNDYMYKVSHNQTIYDIYQYFSSNKNHPFRLLNFLSSYQSFFNVYKLYPIVRGKIVYWIDEYVVSIKDIQNWREEQQLQRVNICSLEEIIQILNNYCEVFYIKKMTNIPQYYERQLISDQIKYFECDDQMFNQKQ